MDLSALAVLSPYLLSLTICIVIGGIAYHRRALPGAKAFGMLAFMEAEWVLCFILQGVSQTLAAKLFWNNLQFLGAIFTSLAYYLFSLQYSGFSLKRSRVARYAAILSSVIVLLIIWTDFLHHQFRINPVLGTGSPITELIFTPGPAFTIFPIFAYGLIILGTYILANNYLSASRVFRLQTGTILIGILIPWVSSVVIWINWIPLKLHEITPLLFGLSNLIVSWALFRYQLFDLTPLAYQTLVNGMKDGVIVLQADGRIIEMNPPAQKIFNINPSEAIGKSLLNALPAFQGIIRMDSEKVEKKELALESSSGLLYYEVAYSLLYDQRQRSNGMLIQISDITEQKYSEQKLHYLAITDPLTGLYNRRYFFEQASRELERSLRNEDELSILLIDIDHFKQVNDTLGHQTGDQVLKMFADFCQSHLRSYDIMARYGGEEFIILLPSTSMEEAYQTAERLRSGIAGDPLVSNTNSIEITISIGVATQLKFEALTLDEMINRADQVLYQAKDFGRNLVGTWNK